MPFHVLNIRPFYMKNNALILFLVFLASACQPAANGPEKPQPASEAIPSVVAIAQTEPTASNGASDPALLINSDDPTASLIVASADDGGLEVYSLDGTRVGSGSDRPSTFVDVRYNFSLGGEPVALIVANDSSKSELVAYTWDAEKLALLDVSTPIELGMETEGLCLFRSSISEKLYAFVVGSGVLQQWELFDRDGQVNGRLTRTIPVGPGAAHCAVSDREGMIYFSQETVGVARLNAEPESESDGGYIDMAMPYGRYTGDIKGVALYEHSEGSFLIVSDADASLLHVYDTNTDKHVGVFGTASGNDIDAIEETEGLVATSVSLSSALDSGVMVLTDDDNAGENTNFKIIAWGDVAGALQLPSSTAYDPTIAVPGTANTVSPSAQTEPVTTFGDAADDPAIWVHPTDPTLSVFIGTQKKRGINVYDMDGSLLQSRPDGRINNTDVRYGFMLDGESVDIVTASNRTHESISIWKVDVATRTLVDIADGIQPTEMGDPYGQCMYKSPVSGDYFVFINDTDGFVKQWQLLDAGNGKVRAELAREFHVGSQTEGCAADDGTGALYIGEENAALWKYSAEPDGGEERTMIDNVDTGNITADVEGVAIYYGSDGAGYLIASNQGADNYLVYERQGDNKFIGHFHVVADELTGIDGASETDGLDVTSANLGPAYPNGALIVQDGRNISPVERQNFKIVPWERVAESLGLTISSGYDPRAAH